MNRIKARFEALITPYYGATLQSRGRKLGHNQGHKDHAKAADAQRGAKKPGDHPSILSRWQNDEIYRASQVAIGWTETYVKYLDNLTTVDIKHDAPHRQRFRCENMILMRSDDPNSQAVQLWEREDYKTSTSALMCLQQVQGKGMPHIPMHMTTRQHNTLDPTIQQKLEWLSQNWQTQFSTPVFGWMDKTRHGGILNTGKHLSSGESGNQRSGKTKSGRRNGKRRQQSSIRKLKPTNVVSTVAQVALSSQFFAVLHIHQPCNFLCNRFRVQTVANVVNARVEMCR